MEILTIEVDKPTLEKIHSLGMAYNLKTVDVKDYDYTDNKKWQMLKSKSIKAYKELKNHEYNIRHNDK